jgi:hypothetical protein
MLPDFTGRGDGGGVDGRARDGAAPDAGPPSDVGPPGDAGPDERCNRSDDDGDGRIDEGLTYAELTYVTVTNNAVPSVDPSVAWSGTEFAIAWADEDPMVGLYFARASASGTMVGAPTLLIADPRARTPQLVSRRAAGYALAWWEECAGCSQVIRAGLVSPTGGLPSSFMAMEMSQMAIDPAPRLVWTSPGFAVSAYDPMGMELRLVRLNDTLDGIIDNYSPNDLGADRAALASDGTNLSVLWQDPASDRLLFDRVPPPGPPGMDVASVSGMFAEGADAPAMAWTGSMYVIAWRRVRPGMVVSISMAVLSPSGALVAGPVDLTDTAHTGAGIGGPAITAADGQIIVVWPDTEGDGGARLHYARLTQDARILQPSTPLHPMGSTYSASIVWTGTVAGIAWSDGRDGDPEIRFSTLGCT